MRDKKPKPFLPSIIAILVMLGLDPDEVEARLEGLRMRVRRCIGCHAYRARAYMKAGTRPRIYGEWAPRLSLPALSGHDFSAGAIRDVFLTGQINQSGNGAAQMAGLSVDLAIPASLNIFGLQEQGSIFGGMG